MVPPYTNTAGVFIRAIAISAPGEFLSHPPTASTPSTHYALHTFSIDAGITSLRPKEYFIPGVRGRRIALLVIVRHTRRILEDVPSEDCHDPLRALDHAVARQASRARDRGRAGGLAADAGSIDHRLRLENLIVRHRDDHAIRVAHGTDGAIVRHGVADLDRRGDRVRLHAVTPRESLPEAQREWRRALRLYRGETGKAVDQPPLTRLRQRLAEGGRVSEVAGGHHDPLGRLPGELLQQLEHDRLLALETERAHRIEKVHAQPLARLVGQLEALVDAAAYQQRARPVGERLRQLPQGDVALGNEHQRRQAAQGGVGGERGGRVAGRRARHRARANAPGLCHAHRHAAVLERPRGVLALVLEQQGRNPRPACYRRARHEWSVALGVAKHIFRRRAREHRLAVAPHARCQHTPPHAPARVERRPQRTPARGRLVAHLEQAVALRAASVGVGLGNLAATARAELPGVAHAPAIFNTSFRMPPAVTASPAPGPVMTSGFFL